MRILIVGAIFVASAGTLSAQEMKVVSSPPIGQEMTVPVGEEIYSFIRLFTIGGYQIDADTMAGHWLLEAPVIAGTQLVPVTTTKAAKGCVPYPNSFKVEGPCFVDDDGDGTFDRHSGDETTMFRKLKRSVPYSSVSLTVAREDSFRRVILFQGATADTLRFSYREFTNDVARPAFTEELSVLRETLPATIMVKNLQIKVVRVSGMGLTYRIIKAN